MQQIKFKTQTTVVLPIGRLENNTGQIEGLPANPRRIDRAKYEKLKKSLTDNPEFLETNPLKVFADPNKPGHYVIIGGNMRRRALQDLGYTDVPCAVLDPATPAEKLRAYTILDNSNFGTWNWDMMANEWEPGDLDGWGVDLPDGFGLDEDGEREAEEDGFDDNDMEDAPTRHRNFYQNIKKYVVKFVTFA